MSGDFMTDWGNGNLGPDYVMAFALALYLNAALAKERQAFENMVG